MLKTLQKLEQLKTVIIQEVCPICFSSEVRYVEEKLGEFFYFECRNCHWHSFYTNEEWKELGLV